MTVCGIVGIFDSRGERPIDRSLLTRMNDRHSHRGPDGSGLHLGPGIGLGHRRLSIIDLAAGKQPLYNEDETVSVIYNGEIYNYQALAKELIEAGHTFRTRCDTEVIVHAWEEWGEACVERFRGMFAFAIWDENKKALFLARDRVGIKPLYYAELPSGLVLFGSELKSLLAHPELPREIDPCATEDYFAYGYVPDPRTIYRGVQKLAPGHTITFRRNAPAAPVQRRYWDVPFDPQHGRSEAALCEELIANLSEAVDIRLMSEVPLGAFLSGGVDSSTVVAMMSRVSDDPVNTCSIGFKQAGFDETQYAEMVAARYATNHHVRIVDSDSFDLMAQLASIYDEPFADSSAIPTYRVCGLARERVTVALSGDGGDEVFAGYRRHRWHHNEELVRGLLPQPVRGPLFRLAGQLYPKLDRAPRIFRAKATLQGIARNSAHGYFHSISLLVDGLREKLYSPTLRRDLQDYHASEVLARYMENAPSDNHMDIVQYADIKTYLPGDILTKVDRASMAHSLEVRVPLLDHEFMRWAGTVPAEYKLRRREGKYILKKAMEPHLDHEIMYRDKMGFSIPVAAWFRGPLRETVREALAGPVLEETGLFDMGFIGQLVEQHQSGARDHSAPLWALLMYQGFLRDVHGESGNAGEPWQDAKAAAGHAD
jgi:asparagine synthase (glutamine-hydrolysing)